MRQLSDSDVQEVRRLHAAGALQVDLASRFGVSQPTISRIVRGKLHQRPALVLLLPSLVEAGLVEHGTSGAERQSDDGAAPNSLARQA